MIGVDYRTFRDKQYDILADTLGESLDMDQIRKIIERGIV